MTEKHGISSLSNDASSSRPSTTPQIGRLVGVLAGSALAIYGVTRRSKTGAALAAAGGLLAFRNIRSNSQATSYSAHASFAINCSPQEAYRYWHDFENLPRFMRHIDSVKRTGSNRTEWTAAGPLGTPVKWIAETTEDRENERIAWRSVEGSDIETSGSVEFKLAPQGRGTLVSVTTNYVPPAGAAGKAFATLTGKNPEFTVREDLRRFKAILETGELPTTIGQSHGPRGLSGRMKSVLFREEQNQPLPMERQTVSAAE